MITVTIRELISRWLPQKYFIIEAHLPRVGTVDHCCAL